MQIFIRNAENLGTRYRMHIFCPPSIQVRARIRYMSRIFLHASKMGELLIPAIIAMGDLVVIIDFYLGD